MIDLLAERYAWLRALHIIAVIFWMAGMLYLPRLYVYHHRARPGGELETALVAQQRRLLRIIINPAMIAVWALAALMLIANPGLFAAGWFHAKLALVLILSGVHGFYAGARRRFARGERPRTERFWRIMNEVPAVMVIAIVLLAVLKPFA